MKHPFQLKYYLLLVLWLLGNNVKAQDPNRFKDQVDRLYNKEYNFNPGKKLIVFTGSSSIAMWEDVQSRFTEYNVINNGFGGSHFSDLIHFYDKLIMKAAPDILFIYEGDNDISAEKNPELILNQAKQLVNKIHTDLPNTKLILISPKPSIARNHLKKEYLILNSKLEQLCKKIEWLYYVDVWNAMVDENGDVFRDIFLEDNLHMNSKGYDIWTKVISEFLKQHRYE